MPSRWVSTGCSTAANQRNFLRSSHRSNLFSVKTGQSSTPDKVPLPKTGRSFVAGALVRIDQVEAPALGNPRELNPPWSVSELYKRIITVQTNVNTSVWHVSLQEGDTCQPLAPVHNGTTLPRNSDHAGHSLEKLVNRIGRYWKGELDPYCWYLLIMSWVMVLRLGYVRATSASSHPSLALELRCTCVRVLN